MAREVKFLCVFVHLYKTVGLTFRTRGLKVSGLSLHLFSRFRSPPLCDIFRTEDMILN